MSVETRANVHEFFGAPPAWVKEFRHQVQLPLINHTLPNIPVSQEEFNHLQRGRFIQKVGIAPEDIHITIGFPIHNERTSFPSAWGSFVMSDLPRTAHVDIYFIENGSTDFATPTHLNQKSAHDQHQNHDEPQTIRMLRQLLHNFGSVTSSSLPIDVHDDRLCQTMMTSASGNWRVHLVQTATPSKANAINILSEFAAAHGDPYFIAYDANNWQEYSSVVDLIADAQDNLTSNSCNKTAIVAVKPTIDMKPPKHTLERALLQLNTAQIHKPLPQQTFDVTGWGIAYKTSIFETVGKMPPIMMDDYGYGLIIRLLGYKIEHSSSTMWGYTTDNIYERFLEYARLTQGFIQLEHYICSKYPNLKEITIATIRSERPISHDWLGRLHVLKYFLTKQPTKWIRHLGRYVYTEFVRRKADHDYKRNPQSQTWNCLSTK